MSSPIPQSSDIQISQSDALTYWNTIPATVDGMLGGFAYISRIDLRGSANFLAKLRYRQQQSTLQQPSGGMMLTSGVDCGAGIGRVTIGFLSKVCERVDVVEPIERFVQEVRKAELRGEGKLGEIFVTGLEDWNPAEKVYNLIWNQWCLGHLMDEQLVAYLRRCSHALAPGGWIVVKENMSTNWEGRDIPDALDNSITRTDQNFRNIFKEAGLTVIMDELQAGFPKKFYPVRSYALQPTDLPSGGISKV
jgi:protein N-terminal methyltransferase